MTSQSQTFCSIDFREIYLKYTQVIRLECLKNVCRRCQAVSLGDGLCVGTARK